MAVAYELGGSPILVAAEGAGAPKSIVFSEEWESPVRGRRVPYIQAKGAP